MASWFALVRGWPLMAVISLSYRYLEKLVGTDRQTIISRLPMIGSDIERTEEDHVDVEFFPSRPDLFSVEGVARAMRGFSELKPGRSRYRGTRQDLVFHRSRLASIRPYLDLQYQECFIRCSVDPEPHEPPEALHWAVGREGARCIGVHDQERFRAVPLYCSAPGQGIRTA